MESEWNRWWRRVRLFAFALLAPLGACGAEREDFYLESVGLRYGWAGNSSSTRFNEVRVFADWNLPLRIDLGKGWEMPLRLDLSAGWLGERDGDNAAIFGIGPHLLLRHRSFPVSLVGGVEPTFLTRSTFESKNVGTLFQFVSFGGLDLDIAAHWRIGYRYQHMSNAGLGSSNPGLNLNMLVFSCRF
jgi:hypothetical protein